MSFGNRQYLDTLSKREASRQCIEAIGVVRDKPSFLFIVHLRKVRPDPRSNYSLVNRFADIVFCAYVGARALVGGTVEA